MEIGTDRPSAGHPDPQEVRIFARSNPILQSTARILVGWAFASCASLALLATPNAAVAQTPPQSTPEGVVEPTDAAAPIPGNDKLFRTWGGVRPVLENYGVNLNIDFITQTAGDVSGGMRRGVDYAQQIGAGLDIDWSKLANIDGFSTHAVAISRAGRNVSNDYTGDRLIQLQDIYGSFHVAARLAFAFAEEKFANGAVDLSVGHMPIQIAFDNSDLYCNFMTGALCGDPRAISATPGVTPFPVATWGSRVRFQPSPEYYAMVGLYEVNPHNGGRAGLDWSTNGATGVTVPIELGYEPTFGAAQLPGHYKLGMMQSTAPTNDLFSDINGNPAALSGLPAEKHSGATVFYALADQMLWRYGPGVDNGLVGLGGYEHGSSKVSQFQDSAFIGLLDSGTFPSRPQDKAGLLFTYVHVSDRLAKAQRLEAEFDLPYSAGAAGVQSDEEIIELNYDIAAFHGVSVMPDFQYILRPGATSTYPNAAVLGLKTHVFF